MHLKIYLFKIFLNNQTFITGITVPLGNHKKHLKYKNKI